MAFMSETTKADLKALLADHGVLRQFAHLHPYTLAIIAAVAGGLVGAILF